MIRAVCRALFRRALLPCLLALLLLPASALAGGAISVQIGGARVTLPDVAGYDGEVYRDPLLRKSIRIVTTSNITTLWVYLTDEDAARLRSGKSPEYTSYILVGVEKQFEKENVSAKDFTLIQQRFIAEYGGQKYSDVADVKGLQKDLSENFKKQLNADLTIDNFNASHVRIVDTGPAHVTAAMVTQEKATKGGNKQIETECSADSFILANNRLLQFRMSRDLDSKGAMDDILAASKKACAWITSRNPSR